MTLNHKFCIIMVVKNEEKYISEAIVSALCKLNAVIYLIDDHSADNTLNIVRDLAERFSDRMIYRRNHGIGKVDAYRNIEDLPESDFYLFLDGDDFFSNEWVDFDDTLDLKSVYYYDLKLFYSREKIKAMPSPAIYAMDHMSLMQSLILLPKASWVVPRDMIYEYLRIPDGVEFEDIWFSLISYKRARQIQKLNWRWYMYLQHDNQVWGSQSLKGRDILKFRVQRILNSLEAIVREKPEFSSILIEPLRRYTILNSMSPMNILMKLGVREYVLFILKTRCPGFLMMIKRSLRSRT
jgi:glycosyltransferase involved in cell wall biosynthesis